MVTTEYWITAIMAAVEVPWLNLTFTPKLTSRTVLRPYTLSRHGIASTMRPSTIHSKLEA